MSRLQTASDVLEGDFGFVDASSAVPPLPLYVTTESGFKATQWPQTWQTWFKSRAWKPKTGKTVVIPGARHSVEAALAIISDPKQTGYEGGWSLAHLPAALPPLHFALDCSYWPAEDRSFPNEILVEWLCGWGAAHIPPANWKTKQTAQPLAQLVWPEGCDADAQQHILRRTRARRLARYLIDVPANSLAPLDLAHFAKAVMSLKPATGGAKGDTVAGCTSRIITGQELEEGYPAIHAVGVSSERPPALFEADWTGAEDGPSLTIIGKGVVFDTGGYNIKPGNGMRLMKKDMGGAAHALALAWMCVDARLPIRLKLLIPCAENSISGQAMRPGDIISTRKGLQVEIGNTDAEGRLLLADALTAAGERDAGPSHRVLDFATLTGAARVALGTEIPALFCNDEDWAVEWAKAASHRHDMVWRLPLWLGYEKAMVGKRADLDNDGSMGGFGGAITAALFLQHFVPKGVHWSHIDLMAYNNRARPGRPEGGEAQGLMSAFETLKTWCTQA